MTSWTDARIALLKKLHADGLSASQIARAVGGVTRNAVIGKASRMGLGPIGGGKASTPRTRGAEDWRYVARGGAAQTADARKRSAKSITPEPAKPAKISRPALTAATRCRWPIGDPEDADFTYCGDEINRGSYCCAHASIAYQPRAAGGSANNLARSLRRYV